MSSEVEQLRARLALAEQRGDRAQRVGAALSRIIRRINASPLDLAGTLVEICAAARTLTDADTGYLFALEGEHLRIEAAAGVELNADDYRDIKTDSIWPVAQAVRDGVTVSVDDFVDYLRLHGQIEHETSQEFLQTLEAGGVRSTLAVPLGSTPCYGGIVVVRKEIRPFDSDDATMIEAFAGQAVNAFEIARTQQQLGELNKELAHALEQQTATASVLESISHFGFDLDEVLNTVVREAAVQLRASVSIIFQVQEDRIAQTSVYAPTQEIRDALLSIVVRTSDDDLQARVIRDQRARSTTIRAGNPGRSPQEAMFRQHFGRPQSGFFTEARHDRFQAE